MPEPIDPTNADRYLTAFADGELDADQGRAVLHYLAVHPEAASRVESELKFRQAVGRVMTRTPAASASLRDAIGRMVVKTETAPAASTASSTARPTMTFRPAEPAAIDERRLARRLFLRRTLPLAAAASIAFLAIGVVLGRRGLHGDTTTAVNPTPLPVPATYIAEATRTHVDCSRYPSLHVGTWP